MTTDPLLPRFPDHDAGSAPAAARPLLERVTRHLGYLPAAVARMAAHPALLDGFLRLSANFEAGTLAPVEVEVLVWSVAVHNGCELCVAQQTARLVGLDAAPELVADPRAGRSLSDPRLEVLRRFTLAVMTGAGRVDDRLWGSGWESGLPPPRLWRLCSGSGPTRCRLRQPHDRRAGRDRLGRLRLGAVRGGAGGLSPRVVC